LRLEYGRIGDLMIDFTDFSINTPAVSSVYIHWAINPMNHTGAATFAETRQTPEIKIEAVE
tara:strand:- start:224 stop:406 length:183 start_codon:yes stop_codon:yes gene_type:complete